MRLLLVLMLALTALSFVPATTALAATGNMYLGSAASPGSTRATDPHGNIWLAGTTDGTTAGPLDPGTDPTSASYGHLWTTDVPSGFCRIIPAVTDPGTGAVTPAIIDRNTPGGCIVAGGKAGQPEINRNTDGSIKRNADGTIYVYTPDWAVRSAGVYRLTYDPGSQTMKGAAELLAPNRYTFDNKPFDVQMGLRDRKLYVSSDKSSAIDRITGVDGTLSLQTVEKSIALSNDGKRVRAITFACWSNLNSLNPGGALVSRAAGASGCTATNPVPDLVVAQFNTISVVLNAEDCQALQSCAAIPTGIKVLTPMGLRTDPANASIIYISDSPGADAQIIRYNTGTNIQDSYANYGILDDGTVNRFSFVFSVGFGPDHAMYVGDDPSAGSTAFNGHYFRVAPNAPADTLGKPGAPGTPPPPPGLVAQGTLYGGTFTGTAPSTTSIGPPSAAYSAVTLPSDGVWMGTHLWMADQSGMCRMDVPPNPPAPAPASTLAFLNVSTCMLGAKAAGLAKPEQSAFDAAKNLLYVADGGSKSVGVVRFTFDPTGTVCTNADGTKVGVAEILCSSTDSVRANQPQLMAPQLNGTGLGLDGQRADAVALDPTNDLLYVGFRARNLTAATQIARVHNASADTFAGTQAVDFVSKTTRSVPVFGLGLIANADGTRDLYAGDNKGVDVLYNVNACAVGECTAINLLNVRGPRGFTTDGKDNLYMAGPPPPGAGNNHTVVQRYTISTGTLTPYTAVGTDPDGVQQQYAFVFSLAVNPTTGDLYVGDNAQAVAPPSGLGHIWKVAPGQTGVPATVPGAPTIGTATAGNASATVTWTAPASDGGSAITSYTVTASDPAIPVVAVLAPATSATVTGLTNGSTYTFTVAANNLIGTGPASAASNSVTPTAPATAPGAPTIGTATAGNASATVTWTAPASDGGSPITGYTVTSTPAGGTTGPLGATATSATVTGLTNGTAYTFTVTATNAIGPSPASAASNSVTPTAPATAPGAPTIGTATAGNASATVTWTAPASTGGSPITFYTVTSTPASPNSPLTVSAPAGSTAVPTSATVTGLTNGTAYTFTVTATNAIGTSPASAASNSVTPVAPPPAQTGLAYYPLAKPIRLLDTRAGQAACNTPAKPLAANVALAEVVSPSACLGIPAGAKAVAGNAAVVNNTGAAGGFVTLYPTGVAQPTVSNLNYAAGQVLANAFVVALGADGGFNAVASSGVNLIIDIAGYYA